jgi:hypothetical protein
MNPTSFYQYKEESMRFQRCHFIVVIIAMVALCKTPLIAADVNNSDSDSSATVKALIERIKKLEDRVNQLEKSRGVIAVPYQPQAVMVPDLQESRPMETRSIAPSADQNNSNYPPKMQIEPLPPDGWHRFNGQWYRITPLNLPNEAARFNANSNRQ